MGAIKLIHNVKGSYLPFFIMLTLFLPSPSVLLVQIPQGFSTESGGGKQEALTLLLLL